MIRSKKFRSASDILSQHNSVEAHNLDKSKSLQPRVLTQRNETLPESEKDATKPSEPSSDSSSQNTVLPTSQPLPPPASQRRYLSQRSNVLGKSQSVRSLRRIPLNYFESVLLQCDVDLDHGEFYVLNCDHVTFLNKFKNVINTSANYPENIQQFLEGLENDLKDELTFKKLLGGCLIQIPDVDRIPQSQESMIKLFLMVNFLQTDIVELLLNAMKRYALNDNLSFTDSSVISLILSQLRTVNSITNGELLFNKIFEVLEVANENIRPEIIRSFEDVIDLSRHDAAIKKLMELIPDDFEFLTSLTVDTIGNMCIGEEVARILRAKILKFLKNGAPLALYPSLIKFLFKFDNSESDIIPDLIAELRVCLIWNADKNDAKEIQTVQKSIFECIKRSLTISKLLFNGWLKAIQTIDDKHDHKPIDIIVLVIMIAVNDEKANAVESIFKRRIKNELFTSKLLEKTVQEMPSILLQYLPSFMECVDNFFRDRDQTVAKFARSAYRFMFGIEGCDRKLLLSKLIAFVCEKHIDLPFVDIDIRTNALLLLLEINKKYAFEMQNNGLQLLRILDRIGELTIQQFRMVLELLCSIAYPLAPLAPVEILQDHINMLVRKQVASSIMVTKKQGIVGVIRVVDHIAWSEDDTLNSSGRSDKTISSVSDVPEGPGRLAAKLTDLMLTSASATVESLAFAYDELAVEFSSQNRHPPTQTLNQSYLNFIVDRITMDFQDNFLAAEDVLMDTDGGTFEAKFCINDRSETTAEGGSVNVISMNIAGLVFKPTLQTVSSITILSPIFNLLRTLHFIQNNGSLDSLNACLGCGIIVPQILDTPDVLDIFDEFDESRSKKVLDIHFYCANWFRELISAFAQDTILRKKVLLRLTELIKLEATIRTLLKLAPISYTPPACSFLTPQKETKAVKFKRPADVKPTTSSKRVRKSPTAAKMRLDQTTAPDTDNLTILQMRTQNTTIGNMDATEKHAPKKNYGVNYGSREVYRQIDKDIMLLLDETLELTYPLSEDKVGTSLGLLEIKFVLEDLVLKIESISGVKKFSTGQPLQYIISPSGLISDLVKYLPKVMQFFEQFADHLQETLAASNGIRNHHKLFTDEIIYTKICFYTSVRLLAALFSWPDFENDQNEALLKDSLFHLIHHSVFSPVVEPNVKELALQALKRIIHFEKTALDITSAVHMFHLCRNLSKYVDDNDGHELVVDMCHSFLSRIWYSLEGTEERSAQCNVMLDELVQGLLKNANLKVVQKHVGWLASEAGILKDKNGVLKTFPCFNKANIPLLFRALCKTLISAICDQTGSVLPSMKHLKVWEQAVNIMDGLLTIVRAVAVARNSSLFFKYSQIFLKNFLGNGFVMLESCLKKCPERVIALLRTLQGTTRYLHSLCCQSKAIKDSSIIAQIPLIRQTIENLVYRVKAALAANQCNSAFWMGNLKNKDLHGEEILSQLSQVASEVSSNAANSTGEDVIPDDDEEEEEEEDSLEDAMMELHGDEGTKKHDSTNLDNCDDVTDENEETEKRKSDIFSR